MTTVDNRLLEDKQLIHTTILIVEDDEGVRLLLKDLLAFETQYHAIFCITGTEALNAVKDIDPSLFVLNYNLPDFNGLTLYDQLHAIQGLEKVPALLMTARIPDEIADEMKKRDITFVQKPFDIIDLLHNIETMLAVQNTLRHIDSSQ